MKIKYYLKYWLLTIRNWIYVLGIPAVVGLFGTGALLNVIDEKEQYWVYYQLDIWFVTLLIACLPAYVLGGYFLPRFFPTIFGIQQLKNDLYDKEPFCPDCGKSFGERIKAERIERAICLTCCFSADDMTDEENNERLANLLSKNEIDL